MSVNIRENIRDIIEKFSPDLLPQYDSHIWNKEINVSVVKFHDCSVCGINQFEFAARYSGITCGEVCIQQIIK